MPTLRQQALKSVCLQRSPHHGAVGKTGSSDTSITPPVGGAADLDVRQLPQVAIRNGTSTARQLHDSAASKHCPQGDQINGKVEFFTRKDTANIDEAAHIFPTTAESEQAESLLAQMQPFEARKNFLLGPPRPACCPERSKTAEGINKLRQTDDPDISRPITLYHLLTLFTAQVTTPTSHLLAAMLKTPSQVLQHVYICLYIICVASQGCMHTWSSRA